MNYLSKKANSLTGEALSGVNQLHRKKQASKFADPKSDDNSQSVISDPNNQSQVTGATSSAKYSRSYTLNDTSNPVQGQSLRPSPFGGDSQLEPPPIGFRTDLFGSCQNENQLTSPDFSQDKHMQNANVTRYESSDSLYQTDAWSRLWFQRVMILSLIRLLLFIRKIYEDFNATKFYSLTGQTGHLLISMTTLFLPTIVFTIYRVSRYLQLSLPANGLKASGTSTTQPKKDVSNDNELRRALMSSPVGASLRPMTPASNSHLPEDEGLVTARQTPTHIEEFHDSTSHQEQNAPSPSPAPSTAIVKDSPPAHNIAKQGDVIELADFKERVNIDKLGDLPDKETTRIVIGVGEQILHGVLFVFWQLKRQVDVLGYLVERSCLWRRPRPDEEDQLSRLRTGSDGLEWFQDFYAAFLAILAQVYTLGLHWTSDSKNVRATLINAAGGSNFGGIVTADAPDGSAVSNSARSLSHALSQQALVATTLQGKDLLIVSELVVSSAVVFSLLVAVRRRDDGPLTLGLSMLGWGSMFAARIIVISLAFVHIGWHLMLPLIVAHVLGITCWIYKISLDSHNELPSEREESKWIDIDLGERSQVQTNDQTNSIQRESQAITSQWSIIQHIVLLSQIVTLFAIPSLFYWPIMFNLKLHFRPLKYLVLLLSENFTLIPIIWFSIAESNATIGQWYLLGSIGGFSTIGFVFIYFYICCKPSLTEYFARADELYNEAERSGIYFEFCSRIFKMPDLSKHQFRRLMNQREVVEEVQTDD